MRSPLRRVFVVTSALVLLSVLAQFYFAGVGAFHRPFSDEGFWLHALNASVVQGLAVGNTIVAALARAGRGTIGLAILPFVLVNVQYVIFAMTMLFVPEGTPTNAEGIPTVVEGPPNFVVALHVLNALTILAVAVLVLRRARRFAAQPRSVETATVEPVLPAGQA